MDGMRVVYSLILALLLALAVSYGIQAAYAPPDEPAPAEVLEEPGRLGEIEDFQEDMAVYERNVFLIGTAVTIVIAALALVVAPLGLPIRFGLLTGSLLALIWAAEPDIANSLLLTGQSVTVQFFPEGQLDTSGRVLQFLTALAGLAVMLLVGYVRFGERRRPEGVHGESQVEIERGEIQER